MKFSFSFSFVTTNRTQKFLEKMTRIREFKLRKRRKLSPRWKIRPNEQQNIKNVKQVYRIASYHTSNCIKMRRVSVVKLIAVDIKRLRLWVAICSGFPCEKNWYWAQCVSDLFRHCLLQHAAVFVGKSNLTFATQNNQNM